ncbi:phosphatase PAP2 family protein [Telluribacter sp.]|jgi:membrane-associated phospholipid phosphatase|uniref:phosphatase PAP2 family protein n=1 Tax=Telluribacter sp. TaxID=1978767 RepID=UPI002E15EB91|nr:phosphatase PAP2 family protein [Telluribacter sp.]
MKQFLIRQVPFLGPYVLLWLIVAIVQLFIGQSEVILFINGRWNPWSDVAFRYATFVGDNLFVIVVALLLLLYSYRKAALVVLSYAISGIIVQVLKRYVFVGIMRPWYALSDTYPLMHTVEGVQIYHNSSFPSGHTTSAFALFAMLAFISRPAWAKVLLLLPAVVVAYSRMYLLQHFLIDVHTGSLLGVGTSVLLYYYLQSYWESHPRAWHQKGLIF